jgi:hypothetical protein
MLFSCAERGADIAGPLAATVGYAMSAEAPPETPVFLGAAIAAATKRRDPPPVLEATLFDPAVLAWMLRDGTTMFWRAVLARRGSVEVLREVRAPDGEDVGLGLLEALEADFPEAVGGVETRPDFLRPLLFHAVAGRVTPSEEFWKEAFAHPPNERTLRALEASPRGRWSGELLSRCAAWQSHDRVRTLRRLGAFSRFEDVRRDCVHALLMQEDGDEGRA